MRSLRETKHQIMSKHTLNIKSNEQQLLLKLRLEQLQKELDEIEFKTHEFEATLRAHLTNEIVEEQELTVLYKQQKAAKKEKRLAQQKNRKGKAQSTDLSPITKLTDNVDLEVETKLRKKLYREAMLQVHPDKFSMQEDKQDLASEMTVRLIELYSTGSIEDLQAYHQHIFSGHTIEVKDKKKLLENQEDNYWQDQIKRMENLIEAAKARHTYVVLSTYDNPMRFLQELQDYYEDRLFKLRKRTRTKENS